jgi:hypothetical protein
VAQRPSALRQTVEVDRHGMRRRVVERLLEVDGHHGERAVVALDRQDALSLKSAREQGQIDLILRRVGDHAKFDNLEPVTLQYLNKRFKFNLISPITGR